MFFHSGDDFCNDGEAVARRSHAKDRTVSALLNPVLKKSPLWNRHRFRFRPASTAFIAGAKWCVSHNFRKYPNAPASMHASTNSSAECTVTNTNFAEEPKSRSLYRASIPLKIGMLISDTMTSGRSLQTSDTKAAPSAAVPTTSKSGDKRTISTLSSAG
jgi:hypothetical protein